MTGDNFDLSDLEGVGPITKKKLEDSGIHNLMDLIVRGPVELGEISSMTSECVYMCVGNGVCVRCVWYVCGVCGV